MKDNDIKIGVYVCHCGSNIAGTVDVEKLKDLISEAPHVKIAREYVFMCSEPGQDLIIKDIKELGLNRVVVASCSPLMHEPTFRKVCEKANLNRYLFQMVNIREQCSWVHKDMNSATKKASALINAAVRRVAHQEPLDTVHVKVNPNTLVVGGGIAGIQASLEIAASGNKVYLVEKDSTIGGKMAKLDKTFPTLDCSACILTPKMVSVVQHENIELLSFSEIEDVHGSIGDFTVKIRKKARYVNDACTSCGECSVVCPVKVPNAFEENQSLRPAIYKTFPQAIPNTYVIDKEERPPCRETCPIGQEAAGYVGLIANGRFEEAARLIRQQNALPIVCGRVCYHPCEMECNRKFVDEPIAIKSLKRFVMDWEMAHGGPKPPEIEESKPEKIAIIGSGPSGLTCAHGLALKGYKSVIYEKLPVPGGMLAIGIPEYRLPEDLLNREIEYIKSMGVSIKTNMALGKDYTIEDLFQRGFKAVYIATGAHRSMKMRIPGEEEFAGVYHGVDFLRNINLGKPQTVGKRVAIIGGGNTAIDASRTALRLGAEEVIILYRRTRKEMPAAEPEIQAAEEEGVRIEYLIAPVEVLGKAGKIVGLKCINMELGEPDESGRRRPIPIEGSEHPLDFETVIIAVSQSPEIEFAKTKPEFKLTKWDTFIINEETMETNVPGVFAGGDAVRGADAVITAMADGKRCAEAIEKYLSGEPLKDFKTRRKPNPIPKRDQNSHPHRYAPKFKNTPKIPRIKIRELDPESRRTNFEEVELGYSEEEAIREASRCLNCGICIECHACENVCEAKAINHNMKDEFQEIKVGQVLLTTGYSTLNSGALVPYGYGEFENVYTALEFERIVSSTGPTQGKVVMKNGKEPRAIGIIHCVGSRDINNHPYCSRVCCMYALKFAHLIKDRTSAEVYQFYIDMRSFGKGYEEFYSRVLEEGVNVIRGKVAEVTKCKGQNEGDEALLIHCEDTLTKKYREIPVDMVVLCNAIEPQTDADKIQHLFTISRSPDGFFLEKHPKLDPTATSTDGVYVAGCCQGPKDIPDTVAQASSAAARILANISKGEIEIEPIQAYIDPELCGGCRLCNDLCPYRAISFDEEKGISVVNQALCKGCGTCVSACPSSAATAKHFSDGQIFAEIEGILEDKTIPKEQLESSSS